MEVNGWRLYAYEAFLEQLNTLVHQVEAFQEKDPKGFVNKKETKLLGAINKLILEDIPSDPSHIKFKLGKTGDVVGVLIKNSDTRKNIQREHGLLKNKKLSDVKKYLVEKNLIKIGSMAPPNIVRKIYEDAMLTGEIENIGKGVILHNFLEDKKSW